MKKLAKFDLSSNPELLIDGFDCKLRNGSDFWRMHLDYCESGMNNDLGVYSHQQKEPAVVKNDNETVITYSSLIAEDMSVHNITLELKIIHKNEELHFLAKMTNNSSVRINELQYPFFEFTQINGEFESDELILPLGMGIKIPNPHEMVAAQHTEYKAADYKNIWNVHSYPGYLSMPWMGIQSKDKYLYMGYCGEDWKMLSFVEGIEPRTAQEKCLICTIASYPAVRPSETVTYDGYVLAAFDTDWREGVDLYRRYADKTWNMDLGKHDAKKITGWQRLILKHQYGEIFHTYNELPRLYKEGAKYGLNMLLLFGWWKEGMDNGYPNYEPDPLLGGADELKKAIDEINALGGTVILYASGHLIDVSTDYYKNEGIKYTMKDIEQNEYREFYKFSNNSTLLKRGHKTFATGCHGAPEWRNKLIEIENKHLELKSNGTFFDQLGISFSLCFDDTHEHGNRIDLDPEYRLKTIKMLKQNLKEDELLGTEWAIDRFAPYMDFIHGCGFGESFTEDAYPYIFKYAFPDLIISNRYLHDEKDGWQRHLNYAFIFGLIFDVSIYRGRAESFEQMPSYAKFVKELIDLRQKYINFFTEGSFNIPSISLPDGIKGAEYSLDGKKIIAVWNDTDNTVLFGGKTLLPQKVDVIEMEC